MLSHKLNAAELKQYLAANHLNWYVAQLLENNEHSALWNKAGNLVAATNKYAQLFGFAAWQEMVGISFDQITAAMIPALAAVSATEQQYGVELIRKCVALRHLALAKGIPVDAIIVHPFRHSYKSPALINQMPIYSHDGELWGCHVVMHEFNMFSFDDYLYGYEKKLLDIPTALGHHEDLSLVLSQRQYEILFLLSIGFSQHEAAQILNISRSTIASVCNDVLAPKFGLPDANLTELVKQARKMNLHKTIPVSLCRPWVILLGVWYKHDKVGVEHDGS